MIAKKQLRKRDGLGRLLIGVVNRDPSNYGWRPRLDFVRGAGIAASDAASAAIAARAASASCSEDIASWRLSSGTGASGIDSSPLLSSSDLGFGVRFFTGMAFPASRAILRDSEHALPMAKRELRTRAAEALQPPESFSSSALAIPSSLSMEAKYSFTLILRRS